MDPLWAQRELCYALSVLAAPAETQRVLLAPSCVACGAIEDYDCAIDSVRAACPQIITDRPRPFAELHDLLRVIAEHECLASLSDPRWGDVRERAGYLLTVLGWTPELPPPPTQAET